MRRLFFQILLFFTCIILSGQDGEQLKQPREFKHSLGVGAGWTTGYGISYRYFFKKYGIQATFAPYSDHNTTQFSSGLTFIIYLINAENTNLFFYQGNHFFYSKDKYYYGGGMYISGGDYNSEYVDQFFNNGFGIGIEFLIVNRVSFNLMGGYAGYENFDKISLTGETGLYYRF